MSNLLVDRRRMMCVGYTPVNWIMSTQSTITFNTGYIPNGNTGCYVKLKTNSNKNFNEVLVGSIDPATVQNRGRYYSLFAGTPTTGNYWIICIGNSHDPIFQNTNIVPLANTLYELYTFWIGSNECVVNGQSVTLRKYSLTTSQTVKIYLRPNTPMYKVMLSQGSNIVREFLPVRRNFDGKLGWLETYTQKFIKATDSGEIVYG